jgi:hypothetical protein
MSRLDSATGLEGSASDRAAYETVQKMLGQAFFTEKAKYPAGDLFGALLHAPRVAQKIIELGGSLRNLGEPGADGGTALPDDFMGFVAIVIFTDLGREAVAAGHAFAYRRPLYNHIPRATDAGMRPAAIAALRAGDDAALLPKELELARFVRAVVGGSVDDELWKRMLDRLGPQRTLETAAYALLDVFVCRLESALGLRDATEAELDAAVTQAARIHKSRGDLSL